MSDFAHSSRAGEPDEAGRTNLQREVEWLRSLVGVRQHTIAGKGWVRSVLAGDGPEGLAMVLEQVAELHDLALASEKWWRDAKTGEMRCEIRADVGSALDCLRTIAQLAALKTDGDELARKAAALPPEERAAAILKDPVHAPILRRMIAEEKKR